MKNMLLSLLCIAIGFGARAQKDMSKGSPLSAFIKVDNMLYISGQVGIDRSTGKLMDATFESEVTQVMTNLQTQLTANNLTFDDLVSVIIYLKDMKNYAAVNETYRKYFQERFPTRTCIAVADLPANANVEISGIAHFKK